jgi:hypothetical protein
VGLYGSFFIYSQLLFAFRYLEVSLEIDKYQRPDQKNWKAQSTRKRADSLKNW